MEFPPFQKKKFKRTKLNTPSTWLALGGRNLSDHPALSGRQQKKNSKFWRPKKNWKFESAILVRRPSEASSRNNWCVSTGIMGSSCDFQGFPPPPPSSSCCRRCSCFGQRLPAFTCPWPAAISRGPLFVCASPGMKAPQPKGWNVPPRRQPPGVSDGARGAHQRRGLK